MMYYVNIWIYKVKNDQVDPVLSIWKDLDLNWVVKFNIRKNQLKFLITMSGIEGHARQVSTISRRLDTTLPLRSRSFPLYHSGTSDG